MVEKKRPNIPVVRNVNWRIVQVWTAIQAACALTIFAVAQFAEVGYIYPALLTALVPFRSYILDRLFDADDLKHLDPVDETQEEYHDEQKAIHLAQRQGSFDSEEFEFPSRAEFRPDGRKKEEWKRRHRAEDDPFADRSALSM